MEAHRLGVVNAAVGKYPADGRWKEGQEAEWRGQPVGSVG